MLENKAAIRTTMTARPRLIPAVGSTADLALAIGMAETNALSSNYPLGDVYSDVAGLAKPTLDARGLRKDRPGLHAPSSLSLRDQWGNPDARIQTAHAFGDAAKRGDAANYGLFKMNWFMIKQTETGKRLIDKAARVTGSAVKDPSKSADVQQTVGQWINADTATATLILDEAMSKWSMAPPDPVKPETNNFWAGHRWGQTGIDNGPGLDWHDVRRYYDAVHDVAGIIAAEPDLWNDDRRLGLDVPSI